MKYRILLFFSVIIFTILSSTIGVFVNSQTERPRENRGEPACTIIPESSGRRTAYLDCINGGTIDSSQECTPTVPSLQKSQLIEVFPQGRRNC